MPNYNLSKVKIFFSFEDGEEVLNLRLDENTCYSKKLESLPTSVVTKLTSNVLDFNFQLNPDFLYSLIGYFENSGRYILDDHISYKGLTRSTGSSNFIFEPKNKIKINWFFQSALHNAQLNNSKTFIDWAEILLSLLNFCEDSQNSLTNLLKVIQFQNNEIFVVGNIVESDSEYLLLPQLTVANLLAGQPCIPVNYPLSEFLPDIIVATETGVHLKELNTKIVAHQTRYAQLQQTLIERANGLDIKLLPEDYQEVKVDTYSQEELELENDLFYTPTFELFYAV